MVPVRVSVPPARCSAPPAPSYRPPSEITPEKAPLALLRVSVFEPRCAAPPPDSVAMVVPEAEPEMSRFPSSDTPEEAEIDPASVR